MTGEDYQQIVCEGNQAKDNECSNHRPLKKCKEFIRILKTVNDNERGKYNIEIYTYHFMHKLFIFLYKHNILYIQYMLHVYTYYPQILVEFPLLKI